MNTVAKGDTFEQSVFDAISGELKGDRLGLSPSSAKIFRKKGYYSHDRKTDIIVDISIEVWPPEAENYSILWVCECKDYGHSVPVDDVEEFKAKLDQIAGKNVKGVFATSNSLQSGAFSYAQSNGIGVVRILPDRQVQWLTHFVTSDMPRGPSPNEFVSALTREGYVGHNQEFFGACEGYCMDCWFRVLHTSLKTG